MFPALTPAALAICSIEAASQPLAINISRAASRISARQASRNCSRSLEVRLAGSAERSATTSVGILTLITLFAIVGSGSFAEARRRVFGQTTRIRDLEQRVATLESALKRARAAELPLEIEAARLAEEINLLEPERRDTPSRSTTAPAASQSTATANAPRRQPIARPLTPVLARQQRTQTRGSRRTWNSSPTRPR
jgi:hypothetical protein